MQFTTTPTTSSSISDLTINFNPSGWGPVNGEKISFFGDVPYAHFDKKDKFGRAADFAQSATYQRSYQRRRDMHDTDFSYRHDAVEEGTFQLVDTSKTQSKSKFSSGGKRQSTRGAPQGTIGSRQRAQHSDGFTPAGSAIRNSRGQATGGRGGRGNYPGGPGGRGGRRFDRKQQDRVPSLEVQEDWEIVEEFDLPQLHKLVANIPKVEDLVWCGHLDQYDENYDKVTARSARPLKHIENKLFFNVTTGDDPVLERFAVDQVGDVYATDSVLSYLMAAPRSVQSWDIVIQKIDGIIFLDNRKDSAFDLLTVSETAQNPPNSNDDIDSINHPYKLALEATMINQNFSQQILLEADGETKQFEPNPFSDELKTESEVASTAYRYRLFTLGNIRLVARCELHCWTTKQGEKAYVSSHALHEWYPRQQTGANASNWRQKIDQQKIGGVLATELKNNSCRLARWTAQSLLAGADQMKLGYVSRANDNSNLEHQILATQFFKPREFAQQINMSLNNIWGIVKMICELLMNKPDGKYVLFKDPNRALVRLFSVPLDTFEEDDEEEEDEDEVKEGLTEGVEQED